jgi:hypothetical protein
MGYKEGITGNPTSVHVMSGKKLLADRESSRT